MLTLHTFSFAHDTNIYDNDCLLILHALSYAHNSTEQFGKSYLHCDSNRDENIQINNNDLLEKDGGTKNCIYKD